MRKLLHIMLSVCLMFVSLSANAAGEETSGAKLIVDGTETALSMEKATEFGTLPAGAKFVYELICEDVKTVSFQIVDVTANEVLKTVTTKQDVNGLPDVVEFELPIQYDLAKGHQYEAQFNEYSTMSTINKKPLVTSIYKFSGIANVAVYSTVKVVAVTPASNDIIKTLDEKVTITFSEAVASVSVKAILGQMVSTDVAASDITTEDNITWTIALKDSYASGGSISLDIVAIDNEGNRVTDPNDGVGTPETCYLQYGWSTYVGLPTPTLVQNGKTYESVEALNFQYEGIGINTDNLTATWKDIVIEKDGAALNLAITESMFKVLGDQSVGGTQLNLTFPEALQYNGVYTVKVPAYAFVLGHDNDNQYNGFADYTFTIAGGLDPEPQSTGAKLVVAGEETALSMEKATEFGTLPAGAKFVYELICEDVKTVSFQIVDVTANEVLKTVTTKQDVNGLPDVVEFELPIQYDLAKGHQYEAQFNEYSTMSTINKTPLVSSNYKFSGIADVAVYSTVKVVAVTPASNDIIKTLDEKVTITFSEAVASVSVKAILGQMVSTDVAASDITTEDNITWTIALKDSYASGGSISLDIVAIDNEGNRVTDPNDGVGTPETCYLQYGWSTYVGLPTPTLVQNGKTYESVEALNFQYEGIGINTDNLTATWKDIVIEKDGAALNLALTEDMFKVLGDQSVGGTQLNLTFPEALQYNGVYTVKLPAYAFVLGHDNANSFNGAAEYTFTIAGGLDPEPAEPEIVLNITKTSWTKIGSESGEVIGTIELKNAEEFDHFEAEIRCEEDPDQYITFANCRVNGGNLTCFAWEGGSYTLNNGYHYILIVKAFDAPYYGLKPVATATYEFVGTGAEAVKYCDITVTNVDLTPDYLLINGYDYIGKDFDITFSAPVERVKVWWAMGMDGSKALSATKNSEDGTVWTINLNGALDGIEGAANIQVTAWNAEGIQMRGEGGDHSYPMNLIITDDPSTAIAAISAAISAGEAQIYTAGGAKVNSLQQGVNVVRYANGIVKKIMVK